MLGFSYMDITRVIIFIAMVVFILMTRPFFASKAYKEISDPAKKMFRAYIIATYACWGAAVVFIPMLLKGM